MSSHNRFMIRYMIRKYGQDLPHKKKVSVDMGNGEYDIFYKANTNKRGQVNQISPLDVAVNKYGQRIEADYIVTFLPDTDVHHGDMLYIDDCWVEVVDWFDRRTGGKKDYIECHCRRRSA